MAGHGRGRRGGVRSHARAPTGDEPPGAMADTVAVVSVVCALPPSSMRAAKEDIARNVKEELQKSMTAFGFQVDAQRDSFSVPLRPDGLAISHITFACNRRQVNNVCCSSLLAPPAHCPARC